MKENPAKAMPLVSHFIELRKRLFKSAIAIAIASFIGWFLYEVIINKLASPICDLKAATESGASDCGILYINGVLGPIDLKFKISILLGVLIAAPIWLYQLWAFIAPGLHKKERRNSILFVIFAVPFFAIGVYAGYLVLPIAVDVLLSFTPNSLSNLVKFDDYLGFVTQLILVFGIAFELPVFLVALNLAGILSGSSILKPWRYSIFAITLFSAIFTPTGDPITMFFLAVPLILLYLAAGGISLLVDRKRQKRSARENG
ncbi:MAG: twin-arginine translocase subunit TatC [Candidatus Nanopelagicaceae bacterium]